MMRALVYDGHLHLQQTYPQPARQGDQALLKLRRAGICNTDLELIGGLYGFSGIPGHEFVADVVDGPEEWLGRRVVGEINVADGNCDFCQRGIPSQCRHRTTVGIIDHPGAFADYLALTCANLHPVPDTVSDDAAVFVEPLAAALQVLEATHITPRDRVIVLGLGKLGLLVAQVLKLTGAQVIGVVRRPEQAALLARWHIPAASLDELEPAHAQVVVECTGNDEGLKAALNLVQPRGTIVLKSTYRGQPTVDMTRVVVDEIRLIGSRCGPFDAALRLLAAGHIDTESLIAQRFAFADVITAVDEASKPGMLKVLLDF